MQEVERQAKADADAEEKAEAEEKAAAERERKEKEKEKEWTPELKELQQRINASVTALKETQGAP